MKNKIPPEAFVYYAELGPDRSYEKVGHKFKVSTRAVAKAAKRENWTERMEKIERESREKIDKKIAESEEERHPRHMKMLRAMAGRSVKAIQDHPLTDGMQGIKAAEIVIKLERLLAGDPNERMALDLKEVTKQEMQRLLTNTPIGTDGPDDW